MVVLVEYLQLAVVLAVCDKGGLEGIKEKYGAGVYCAISIPLLFVIFIKMIIFLQETAFYICSFLFYNISEISIILALLLTCFYLGIKGARTIGRGYEVCIWIIPIIAIFGIAFGKIDLEEIYLTPIFEAGANTYISAIGKYLVYMFDFSPLLFVKIKTARPASLVVSSLLATICVSGCYALFIATYGNAAGQANCAFARLATFNTVESEIGSLDWPSTLLWITTGVLSLSLKMNAVEHTFNAMKIKKFGSAAFCIALAIVLIFKITTIIDAINATTNGVQYAVFGVEMTIPIIALCLISAKKNEETKLYAAQN
jgi:hypothetical protein